MRTFVSSPLLVTIDECASQTKLNAVQVKELIRSGELVAIQLFNKQLIVADSVRAFIKRTAKASRVVS
jgi:hypothetical protein